jgi:hypothetical protein
MAYARTVQLLPSGAASGSAPVTDHVVVFEGQELTTWRSTLSVPPKTCPPPTTTVPLGQVAVTVFGLELSLALIVPSTLVNVAPGPAGPWMP